MDQIKELEKYKSLYDEGAISEEEFRRLKQKLLGLKTDEEKELERQQERAKALAEIERACFLAPWSENMLREELGKGIFLVAEQDGRTAGYVAARPCSTRGILPMLPCRPTSGGRASRGR